jgi:purine-nucleoside phosphorylase
MLLTGHLDCTFQESPQQPQPVTNLPYYVPALLKIARRSAQEVETTLREGIYCWTLGPAYETPDEIRYFQSLGGAAVGMSTVPEIKWAGSHGLKPLAISMLTNFAAGLSDAPLSHEEVIETANSVKDSLLRFLTRVIQNIEGLP